MREHIEITDKQLNQPFYYTKWYYCINTKCKTKLIMSSEFKVWNNNQKSRELHRKQDAYKETQARLEHFNSL